jgi:hypothetical protein
MCAESTERGSLRVRGPREGEGRRLGAAGRARRRRLAAIGAIGVGLVLVFVGGSALVFVLPLTLLAILLTRVTAGGVRAPDWRFVRYLLGVPAAVLGLGFVVSAGGCAADAVHEDWTRASDLETAAANVQPLIAAIAVFREREGRYPRELDELVPRDLPAIPETGLARWGRYSYFERRPDGFDVEVWIPIGWFDMTHDRRFLYAPDPSRDAELGATLRRGEWVYVPD